MNNIRTSIIPILIILLQIPLLPSDDTVYPNIYNPDMPHPKNVWQVLPIRSETEYQQQKIGGEAEQHLHGITRCMTYPDTIYLSHDVSGVWKSTNGGRSWNKTLDIGLYVKHGQSIAVDPINPDIVHLIADNSYDWLAQKYEGLYRSTDSGKSWKLVLQTATNYTPKIHHIFRNNIAYAPSSILNKKARIWYAAFPNNGIYMSSSYGKKWSARKGSLRGHSVCYTLVVHPKHSSRVFCGTNKGLYVSYNFGKRLAKITSLPPGPVTSIVIPNNNPQMIYVTIKNKGLFISYNAGQTFFLQKECNAARFFINPANKKIQYLVQDEGNLLISKNDGRSWFENKTTQPAPGLDRQGKWKSKISGELTGIVPNPQKYNETVAYSRGTIWKTTNYGLVFSDSSTLFTGYAWRWWNHSVAFDMFNPSRFAFFNCDVGMTITNNKGRYFSKRNDQAWKWYQTKRIPWIGTYSGSFQPVKNSSLIIASIGGYFKTQLMRSEDNGKNWTLLDNAAPTYNLCISFHPCRPNIVYAGNKVSNDAGKSFHQINFGAYNQNSPEIIGLSQNKPYILYAMDKQRSLILRSDDNARTWQLYTKPGWFFKKLDSIPTFTIDPKDPDKIYSINEKGDLAFFNGKKWTSTHVLHLARGHKLGNFVRSITVDPRYSNIIYAGMHSSGISCIWRSADYGRHWTDITYNLPRNGIGSMQVNPHSGELFIGNSFGTWILQPYY